MSECCNNTIIPERPCKDVQGCKQLINAHCVVLEDALPCLEIPEESRLDVILKAIDDALCNIQPSCQTLTWIPFIENQGGTAYYAITCQNEVLLKGNVVLDDYGSGECPSDTAILNLPLPNPIEAKYLSLNFYNGIGFPDCDVIPGLLKINTDGSIQYFYKQQINNPCTPELCVDGLSYFLN